jgi:hypothetical protein
VPVVVMALWSANLCPMQSGNTGTPRTRDHLFDRILRNCMVILDGNGGPIASCYCCRAGKRLGRRFRRRG